MGPRRFWGTVWGHLQGGQSSEAGRGGSLGISGHIRGWDHGIYVRGFINEHGRDEFEIYTTGGSNDDGKKRLVARVEENDIYEVAIIKERTWVG